MKTLIVILNLVSFLLSFGAIAWAALTVTYDVRANRRTLMALKEIDARYERVMNSEEFETRYGRDPEALKQAKQGEWAAVGKIPYTYGDSNHVPELVKDAIYSHAARGLKPQLVTVGIGLLVGTVANIWSLYL